MGEKKRVQPLRIAVAHTDPEERRRITTALRLDGHRVASLANAEELVTCLSNWTLLGTRPELLVLGQSLGTRSGAQVAAAIRGTVWEAPVLLLMEPDGLSVREGDVDVAEVAAAVFVAPYDILDLRTVALCLGERRRDRGRDAGERVAGAATEVAGLHLELDFRDVPLLDELVYFVRDRAARFELETGARGCCTVRVQARWRHGCRVHVAEVQLDLEAPQPRSTRLVRSDLDLFSAVEAVFDASTHLIVTPGASEEHDGWAPIRRRLGSMPPMSPLSPTRRGDEETTGRLPS